MNQPSEKAFVIHPILPGVRSEEAFLKYRLDEAEGLARAINLNVCLCKALKINRISPANLLSKGLIEQLAAEVETLQPHIVIIDISLSPVQQRNLEHLLNTKVIDRTGLILEIFGERAQTKEGRIQVDLAMLEYQRSRLVRAWTHLERQRGGAGFMGGPGETQIEIDRRLIGEKITKLKKDLKEVRRTRDLAREKRKKIPVPIIALIGYTNAGKSTFFNHLTGASIYAEDLPFATLDPTMRKITFNNGQEAILSDTVGFISDLPTHLIEAFKATLEQVNQADIIIHVRDISQPNHIQQSEDVIAVLQDLGIDYESDSRIIEIWNKIDKLSEETFNDAARQAKFKDRVILLSAIQGSGIPDFLKLLQEILFSDYQTLELKLPVTEGKALAWLYEHADIHAREDQEDKIMLNLSIEPANLERFYARFGHERN